MKQRTKGEDWSVARKRLIQEALTKKPNYIKDYMQQQKPSQRKANRRKPCKNCPK
jgi:hypothetical protein